MRDNEEWLRRWPARNVRSSLRCVAAQPSDLARSRSPHFTPPTVDIRDYVARMPRENGQVPQTPCCSAVVSNHHHGRADLPPRLTPKPQVAQVRNPPISPSPPPHDPYCIVVEYPAPPAFPSTTCPCRCARNSPSFQLCCLCVPTAAAALAAVVLGRAPVLAASAAARS